MVGEIDEYLKCYKQSFPDYGPRGRFVLDIGHRIQRNLAVA